MAWAAIDRIQEWAGQRRELLAGIASVAVEELAGCFPGGRLAYRVLGEVVRHGASRLLDPAADVPDIKPAGQALPAEQIDQINAWLETLTTAYGGLLDRLETLAGNTQGEAELAALVRQALTEREDLAREFATGRAEVRRMMPSLSRVEEKLDVQVHVQSRMAVSLEEYKAYLVELPGFADYLQLPAAERQAVRHAYDHFAAGRRDEGAAALLGLLQQRGVGHGTVCHHLGLVYLEQGKWADARRCLEQAGADGPRPVSVTGTLNGITRGGSNLLPVWRSLPRGFKVERKYQVECEVGRGGMASVYRAAGIDRINRGRTLALKVPAPGLMADEQSGQRFVQEIEVSRRLSAAGRPDVVQTLDYVVFDDPYTGRELYGMVMEFIEGQSLAEYLARRQAEDRPLVPDEIVRLLKPVCEALDFAHTQNPPVFHRDVKAQNVMLPRDGAAKLMDFGIARLLDDCRSSLTQRGELLGTPVYMPPEVLVPGSPVDARSDVYLAGNLLLELMTFHPMGDPESRPDCPAAWVQLIADAMSRVRGRRPASVREFLQRLEVRDAESKKGERRPAPAGEAALSTQYSVLGTQPLVVSPTGKGHYRTIGEALKAAVAGARILVRPGTYREGLVLTQPVEIVGDGKRDDIVIESADADCIRMQTDLATVRGRAGTKGKELYAVDVPRGRLGLEDCAITSDALACVAVHGENADPLLRRCTIHDGKASGVFVYDKARGTIEDCDVFGNGNSGVQIKAGGNPAVQRCRINRNGYEAVWIHDGGTATVEDCDLTGNIRGPWDVQAGCEVRRARNKE